MPLVLTMQDFGGWFCSFSLLVMPSAPGWGSPTPLYFPLRWGCCSKRVTQPSWIFDFSAWIWIFCLYMEPTHRIFCEKMYRLTQKSILMTRKFSWALSLCQILWEIEISCKVQGPDFSCQSHCLIFNIHIYPWIWGWEEASYGKHPEPLTERSLSLTEEN